MLIKSFEKTLLWDYFESTKGSSRAEFKIYHRQKKPFQPSSLTIEELFAFTSEIGIAATAVHSKKQRTLRFEGLETSEL